MTAVGSVLAGRYRLEELLARGGMGSVFAAYDEVLHRRVAVKVHRSGSSLDRRRFEREAKVLAGLSHTNLVSVFDAGEEGDDLYVVLELIEGPTLATRIRGGPLPLDEVRDMGRQVAAALAYVHAQRVVHRDVKPSNVMFDEHGHARLGDFGIAQFADATTLTATSTTIGTAAYMAPEQLDGSRVTTKADVYALGLVLLESLTGNRAFAGPPHEAALARLARDPDVREDLPAWWHALLREMTARDPADRPDAADVEAALSERTDDASAPVFLTAIEPMALTPTETLGIAATELLPTEAASTRLATARRRTAARSRVVLWALVGVALLVGAATVMAGADDGRSPLLAPTTTLPSTTIASTTVAPAATPPPPPVVDCAALQAEKAGLDAQKNKKHGHEARQQSGDVEARQHEIDAQLAAAHCP